MSDILTGYKKQSSRHFRWVRLVIGSRTSEDMYSSVLEVSLSVSSIMCSINDPTDNVSSEVHEDEMADSNSRMTCTLGCETERNAKAFNFGNEGETNRGRISS